LKEGHVPAEAIGFGAGHFKSDASRKPARHRLSLSRRLGLKNAVALSNEFKIAAPKFYPQEEKQLGVFHRREQKVRAGRWRRKSPTGVGISST
jgi:hypothetical protein